MCLGIECAESSYSLRHKDASQVVLMPESLLVQPQQPDASQAAESRVEMQGLQRHCVSAWGSHTVSGVEATAEGLKADLAPCGGEEAALGVVHRPDVGAQALHRLLQLPHLQRQVLLVDHHGPLDILRETGTPQAVCSAAVPISLQSIRNTPERVKHPSS